MVTVVSEGVFSCCGLKLESDTDRHLGAETAAIDPDSDIGNIRSP